MANPNERVTVSVEELALSNSVTLAVAIVTASFGGKVRAKRIEV
jgi:hypothetical protein